MPATNVIRARNIFTAIANAIRTKTGGTSEIYPDDMAAEILAIPGGGGGGFDWHQLAQLPPFNSSVITSEYGADFDASGIWCRSARSSFNNSSLITFTAGTMDLSECTSTYQMFSNATALTSVDFSGTDFGEVTTTYGMFNNCQALASVNFTGVNFPKVTNTSYMFYNCKALTSFDSSGFSFAPSGLSSESVFYGCNSLVSLDASAWNTMDASFCRGCSVLESACFKNVKQDRLRNYSFRDCPSLVCVIWGLGYTGSLSRMGTQALDNTPNAIFYVPDSRVNDYISAWGLSSSRIKGISECPQTYLDLYHITP